MSMFGSSNTNPLFGGKPASSIFGNNTAQAGTSPNLLASAPPLGSTTQNPPQSTNIFGQQTQQQPAPGGNVFGGTTTNQPTTSLFGSTTTQQPTIGGTTFGSAPTSQPTTGGSIFGSTNLQQQQQPTANIFGAATNQQPPQQTSFGSTNPQPGQQGSTSLFGGTGTNQQPAVTTSLFGATGPASQQPGTTLLFGSTNTGNQATGGTSLFGGAGTSTNFFGNTAQQQQQQQQQQPSLFGSTTQPAQSNGAFGSSSMFGRATPGLGQSTFGQPSQQAQPQNGGQLALTKSTKFNDLPDNLKQLLENINSHIQGRIQISKDLHQRKLGEEPTKGQEMVRQLQKDTLNTTNVIQNDLRHTEDLKVKVDQAMQDLIVATRIIEAFRNPQSGTSYLKDHAGFPLEFFQRVTQQMVERLTWYKSTIEQIERRLSSSANQVQTPQSIAATLQAQNATFLALASKTAALEAELQKVKTLYTQLWRTKTGSVRDPFNDGDRVAENPGDLGFGGLAV